MNMSCIALYQQPPVFQSKDQKRGVYTMSNKRKIAVAKPERIDGDPEGYDVVFDNPHEANCCKCEFYGKIDICEVLPCTTNLRAEHKPVHYVKPAIKCSTCGASVARSDVIHCDGCTKHCIVCKTCETGEYCEQKEFQE